MSKEEGEGGRVNVTKEGGEREGRGKIDFWTGEEGAEGGNRESKKRGALQRNACNGKRPPFVIGCR